MASSSEYSGKLAQAAREGSGERFFWRMHKKEDAVMCGFSSCANFLAEQVQARACA